MKAILTIFLVLLLPFVAGAQQVVTQLGPAPAGYSWYSDRDAHASVLKPDGWFTRSESKNGTSALFVTKEDIAAAGRYQTGLSLNYITGVSGKSGMKSSEYAVGFLKTALDGNQELMSFANPGKHSLSIGLRIRDDRIGETLHYYLIANDADDSLHLFLFEAPSSEWDSAWKTGGPMLRDLRVYFKHL